MIARDHLGRTYKSFSAMCRAWRIERMTVAKRLDRGLSIEEALTRKQWSRAYIIDEHIYSSVDEICKAYGISRKNMEYRIYDLGLSLEEAVHYLGKRNGIKS